MKPSEFFKFDRNDVNTSALETQLKLNGFGTNEVLASSKLNSILKQLSDESLYLQNLFVSFYVDAINGNDTNDGLTSSTAFKTIKKAVDSVEEGGTGKITLLSNVSIKETIIQTNKNIFLDKTGSYMINNVLENVGTGTTTIVCWYVLGTSTLVNTLKVYLPTGSFASNQACYRISGTGNVQFLGGIEIDSNSTTNYPAILDLSTGYGVGRLNLTTMGNITTNDGGYVVGQNLSNQGGIWNHYSGTIDNQKFTYKDRNKWYFDLGHKGAVGTDFFDIGFLGWSSGDYQVLTGNAYDQTTLQENYFDIAYGTDFYEIEVIGTPSTKLEFYAFGKNQPETIKYKHTAPGPTVTYGISNPIKLDKIARNF